ncbi:hypothetical protein D3C72_2148630 [compost metagenome]
MGHGRHDLDMFIHAQGGGFASGSHGHDAVGTVIDVEIYETFQRFKIDLAVLEHRGDQRNEATGKHKICLFWLRV